MSPSIAAPFDHKRLAETARSDFILPGYRKLDNELRDLSTRIESLCQPGKAGALSNAQSEFSNVVIAWGRIELITFGAVTENNRYERILFWPDRKGIGRRQIQRLIRSKAPSATDVSTLAKKSVAVQGLGALELLLFGKNRTEANRPYRCRYAHSIVANLQNVTKRIIADWADDGAFARIWTTPGPANPAYLKPSETTLELVKAFDQMLEVVRDRRIAPAIGFGPTRRRKRAILWRSGLSLRIIQANIQGARDLFQKGGLAQAYQASIDQPGKAIANIKSIQSEFTFAQRAISKLAEQPQPFVEEKNRGLLASIGFPLKSLRGFAVSELKRAAGLSIGFNASDGD